MADQPNPMQAAEDRIRETAKWWTVSLAGIGGVLVAGSQLSDTGHLTAGSNRLWLAVLGGALAVGGAVVILVSAGAVLTGKSVSLQSVARETPAGAEHVVTDATLLNGYHSVRDIETEYLGAIQKRKEAFAAYYADTGNASLRDSAQIADKRAVTINDIANGLLRVVSYEHLASRWKDAEQRIIFGGLLAVAGISLYAWCAHPPEDAVASAAAPNVLTAPTAKHLTLTATGVDELQHALGKDCDTKHPMSVLQLATTPAGPDVLVEPAPGCSRIRFILGGSWGTLAD